MNTDWFLQLIHLLTCQIVVKNFKISSSKGRYLDNEIKSFIVIENFSENDVHIIKMYEAPMRRKFRSNINCSHFEKSKSRRKKKIRRGRHEKAGTKAHVGICNILYANVNGFRSKCESIKQILVEQDVDVLLLTETKVYKNSAIHFDGYQSFSAVTNKKSGGRLYISIKHGFCQLLLCNRGENAEFITVRMEGKYNGLQIVLVYGPQEKILRKIGKHFMRVCLLK